MQNEDQNKNKPADIKSPTITFPSPPPKPGALEAPTAEDEDEAVRELMMASSTPVQPEAVRQQVPVQQPAPVRQPEPVRQPGPVRSAASVQQKPRALMDIANAKVGGQVSDNGAFRVKTQMDIDEIADLKIQLATEKSRRLAEEPVQQTSSKSPAKETTWLGRNWGKMTVTLIVLGACLAMVIATVIYVHSMPDDSAEETQTETTQQ